MSLLGFTPPAHSSCLTIGLFIYFPTTRVLLLLHNYFIVVLMSEPQGEIWIVHMHCPACRCCTTCGFASNNRVILYFRYTRPFIFILFSVWSIFWCTFQILHKEQALNVLPVLIKTLPARSSALIQSYPSHPSESGGGFNMCWVVILYLCSSVH